MHLLVPLAGLLGIEVEAITDRFKKLAIINTVIAILGAIALVFLLIAAFLALSDALSPIYAALIIAGAALVLAVAVYFGTQIGEGERRRRIAERRRSTETSAFVTTAALTALPLVLKSPAMRTIGIPLAAIAAFLLLGRRGSERADED
jgi:O-antigen/teichoic acid export membrane protein